MKITKYAQSTVMVEDKGTSILVDPGKYNYDEGKVSRDYFKNIDVMLITHKHADHYDLAAVKQIYETSKPKIHTVREIHDTLKTEGIESFVFPVGSVVQEGPFSITATPTRHEVKGELIDCYGALIKSNGQSFYHASDTLYLQEKPTGCDVLMVPINNRGVAMGVDDALRFSKEVNPKLVVPIHYDSPKDSHINPQDFADRAVSQGLKSKILSFGDVLDVSEYSHAPRNI